MSLDASAAKASIAARWKSSIVPTLCEYICIPNQSPHYDPEWATNGLQEQAVELLVNWARAQPVKGMKVEVHHDQGRTPLICITLDGTDGVDETVLLYGHFDKQPPLTEHWDDGLGPYTPVIRDGKLYGRGGADDGYAIFAAVSAFQTLQEQGVAHPRCVAIIEGCEESGSPDLLHYLDKLADVIGSPGLLICLDSGAGDYERLWATTSLRGVGVGTLKVSHLREGVHSGMSSGLVASTFRTTRLLLDRLEDPKTGVLIPELQVNIPESHLKMVESAASVMGPAVFQNLPILDGVQPTTSDVKELLLNRTWRPTLCVTGVDGIPTLAAAGNVMRPYTAVKLSIRMPPSLNCASAMQVVKNVLERDPPFNAHVEFTVEKSGSGWVSPEPSEWLAQSLDTASQACFNAPSERIGEGGSIPFMGILCARNQDMECATLGCLGPQSNAHGPNEFLHLGMVEAVNFAIVQLLHDFHANVCMGADGAKKRKTAAPSSSSTAAAAAAAAGAE